MPALSRLAGLCSLLTLAAVMGPAGVAAGAPAVLEGASLQVGQAVGPFSAAVGTGFGAQGFLVVPAPQQRSLGLRIAAGLITYGSATGSYLDPSGNYAYSFRVTNNLAMLGAGPQLSLGTGGVRPYFYGMLGLGYFYTSTSATDIYGDTGTLNTGQGASHFVLGEGLGAGVRIPVSQAKRTWSIDLALEWRGHNKAQYITSHDLQADSTRGLYFTPRESRADLVVFRVGITLEPRGPGETAPERH